MPAHTKGSRARKAGRRFSKKAQRAISALQPARWEVMQQVRRELQQRDHLACEE